MADDGAANKAVPRMTSIRAAVRLFELNCRNPGELFPRAFPRQHNSLPTLTKWQLSGCGNGKVIFRKGGEGVDVKCIFQKSSRRNLDLNARPSVRT
jgi:hypothetical protein